LNDDHVRLTIEGVEGAKELQALNTLIEIHSDLIANTEANHSHEVLANKNKAIESISNAILVDLRYSVSSNYFEDIFTFHDIPVSTQYKDCCKHLLNQATSIVTECLAMENKDATLKMQALNMAVKSDWTGKALEMTQDKKASPEKVWDLIQHKDAENLVSTITLDSL